MSAAIARCAKPVDADLRRLWRTVRGALAELRSLAAGEARLERLTAWLYRNWYLTLAPPDDRQLPADWTVWALRSAAPASVRWLSGWVVVERSPDGTILAGRNGQVRRLRPMQYANELRPGVPPEPGERVSVCALSDWIDASTGFWCAASEHGEPSQPLSRLYWNVGAEGIGPVLAALFPMLDQTVTRFSLKCPAHPVGYGRPDALVVYLERTEWPGMEAAVAECARQVRPYLRSGTPPLTLRIDQGVGYAEDPGSRESFGESRCRALSAGVLKLLQDDEAGRMEPVAVLRAVLADHGIDPVEPWRCAAADP